MLVTDILGWLPATQQWQSKTIEPYTKKCSGKFILSVGVWAAEDKYD